MSEALHRIDEVLQRVQDVLDFHGATFAQFNHNKTLGRVGVGGFVVGIGVGFNLAVLFVSLYTYLAAGFYSGAMVHWAVYCLLLSMFHFLEFFVTALFQPADVSYESFVINHSKQYTLAAIFSGVEYWLGALLFPGIKHSPRLIVLGLLLMLGGQVLRTLAMCTAGSNFSHQLMERKRETHKLVTSGVYSVLRHPSYVGWFWWSIGTQVLLCNPISLVGYAWAAWRFFRYRIPVEERSLMQFYPDEYPAYMQRTFIGIPGIPNTPLPTPRSQQPQATGEQANAKKSD